MNQDVLQEFRTQILDGYHNAKQAHSEIFSGRKNCSVIIGHLSIASSHINAARAIYVCNEVLTHYEFDPFFHAFSTFSDEVMTNIRTDHSHQWSDIEFQRFHDSYQDVASLLGVSL